MKQVKTIGDLAPPWAKLRKFVPRTRLPGRVRAWLSLLVIVLSMAIGAAIPHDPASGLTTAGIALVGVLAALWARDSRGRAVAWGAIIIGASIVLVCLIGVVMVRPLL